MTRIKLHNLGLALFFLLSLGLSSARAQTGAPHQEALMKATDTASKRTKQIEAAYFELVKLRKEYDLAKKRSNALPEINKGLDNSSQEAASEQQAAPEIEVRPLEEVQIEHNSYNAALAGFMGTLSDSKINPIDKHLPPLLQGIVKVWIRLDHSEYRDVLAFLVKRFNQHPEERGAVFLLLASMAGHYAADPMISRGYLNPDAAGTYVGTFVTTMAILGVGSMIVKGSPSAWRALTNDVRYLYRFAINGMKREATQQGPITAPSLTNVPKAVWNAAVQRVKDLKEMSKLTRAEWRIALTSRISNKPFWKRFAKYSGASLTGPALALAVRHHEQSIPDRDDPTELAKYLVSNMLMSIELKALRAKAAIEKDHPTDLEPFHNVVATLENDLREAQLSISSLGTVDVRSYGESKASLATSPKWTRAYDTNDLLMPALLEGDARSKAGVGFENTMISFVAAESALDGLKQVLNPQLAHPSKIPEEGV